MHRFLDACTSCSKVSESGGGPAGRRIAKRVFTRDGEEITDVHDLVYDQEIWLSYGEDFKPPHGEGLRSSRYQTISPPTKSLLRSRLATIQFHAKPRITYLRFTFSSSLF